MNDRDLNVGDRLEMRYGPYLATGEVVEIKDAGAVVRLNNDARLIGYDSPVQTAPNGTVLTNRADHDFIGRAHWHSQKRVQP